MKKINKKTTRKSQKYVNILEINVNSTPLPQVLTSIKTKVSHNERFYIVTPNPELVLMAQSDILLKSALNSTEFSLPDGIGLIQANKYLSLKTTRLPVIRILFVFLQGLYIGLATFFNREWLTQDFKPIKGRLLFLELMKLADKNGWKVYLLGGEDNEAELTKEKIAARFKNIKIKSEAGPMFNKEGEPDGEVDIKMYIDTVKRINSFQPHLLIVGFQDPKEEKFVYKNYKKLNVGGAIALGGTFRYIAGLSKLPPAWLSSLGLEWFWRLLTEPYRARRVFNAFPVFPLKVFWYKITH